jgi:hypothetical protein
MQGLEALMRTGPARALMRAADEAPDGRAEMRATGLPETGAGR